jgi:Kef-type K+ transport system membrane component KefB
MSPKGLAPDLVAVFVLADLAIVLVAARLVGAAALRLGQPRVVGEIVAGVLIGPSLLGPTLFAWSHPWAGLHCDQALAAGPAGLAPSITTCAFPPQSRAMLGVVGQLGLILYMFLVGLEVDHEALRRGRRAVGAVAIGATAVPLALGVALAPLLANDTFMGGGSPSRLGFGLMVGAMLAVTAFPVMARILEERALTRTPMGMVGIAAAATVSVLMFLAVATAHDVAESRDLGAILTRWAGAAVYLIAVLTVVRWALAPLGRRAGAEGAVDATTFATVLIVVLASSVAADRLGLNVIPGAFLIGAILPARELLRRELNSRLRELTVVILLPVFLAVSGLNTDFTALGWSALAGLALLLAAAVAAKWVGGGAGARLGGLRGDDANAIGVLMNCRGLLVLVVGLVALQSGVISPTLQVGGVLIALVTTVMTGPLLERFLPRPTAIVAGNGDSPDPNDSVGPVSQRREEQAWL